MGASRKTPACLSILPKDIVAHIFSYLHLNNKTAIQLSLLSKEIFSILERRPIMVFHHKDRFGVEAYDSEYKKRYIQELDYMVSTLERYHEHNIHLRTFTVKANPWLLIGHHLLDRLIPLLSIQKGITILNLALPLSSRNYSVPQSVFEAESLVELSLESCTLGFEFGDDDDIEPRCKNLKSLCLTDVRIGNNNIFRINSPQLEKLAIEDCPYQTIQVSGLSLKKITLVDNDALQEASFDVPNIVEFRFSNKQILQNTERNDSPIPKLSFRGNSSGWVSKILIFVETDSDLLKLKMFLAALPNINSKITVIIHFKDGRVRLDEANPITLSDLTVPEIENFFVYTGRRAFSLSFAHAVLNSIFRICRPKTLSFMYCSDKYMKQRHLFNVEYLWNTSLPPSSHFDELLKLLQDHEKMKRFISTFNLKYWTTCPV